MGLFFIVALKEMGLPYPNAHHPIFMRDKHALRIAGQLRNDYPLGHGGVPFDPFQAQTAEL